MIEIKNSKLSVVVSTFGAELQSVKSNDGYEYLWQGNPDVWSGRAPVLFPIVGGLMDDEFIYEGNTYTLEKHGFARFSEFEAEFVDNEKAVFLLKSYDVTKKWYPFEFEFRVIFTLNENQINVEYRVDNKDNKDIYFSFGAHEAYSCPDGLEGYIVEFEKEEPLSRAKVTGNFINGITVPVLTQGNKLAMKDEFFESDALIFCNIKSKKVSLSKAGTGREVIVEYPGFNNLLIWTKPGAEYLCIEPWDGLPDAIGCDKVLKNKNEIVTLEAGKTYSLNHAITFN